MEFRKKVYFDRQEVVEYWHYCDTFGTVAVSSWEGQHWKPDSFDFRTITCSDETFEKRHEGYIPG